MANPDHLATLKEGVKTWNAWRSENPDVLVDLAGADLERANLVEAKLVGADLANANLTMADLSQAVLLNAGLRGANLSGTQFRGANLNMTNLYNVKNLNEAHLSEASMFMANLTRVDLRGADLRQSKFMRAKLQAANLSGANLCGADLRKANLTRTDLSGADLTGARLEGAYLEQTNLEGATLSDCRVYGISVWDARLDQAKQSDLVITRAGEPAIQVDSLEVAQFIYLLLNNKKIRDVIDTVGKKAVLILGRFTAERKVVLDAIREAMRPYGYVPILFDFEQPNSRDTQETIITLAGLARFIIADISDPKSIPQELATIIPTFPSVPVQPLLQTGYEPWGMYDHIRRFPWVLPLVRYKNKEALLMKLKAKAIDPAEAAAKRRTRKQN